ncbi:hypothetical protein [Candidatus Pelagibacter sp.]|uniref:hypothetical protein n=1 Tax=Candidatus Pelagibacter sp. TaxID=2024849 RepID=UPI003F83F4D4
MNKFILFFLFFNFFIGCQTVKEKTDEIVKKENEKLSAFIGKPVSNLKSELGVSNEDFLNENGNKVMIYKTRKYGIPCERKFEIDGNEIVIGFISKGCI